MLITLLLSLLQKKYFELCNRPLQLRIKSLGQGIQHFRNYVLQIFSSLIEFLFMRLRWILIKFCLLFALATEWIVILSLTLQPLSQKDQTISLVPQERRSRPSMFKVFSMYLWHSYTICNSFMWGCTRSRYKVALKMEIHLSTATRLVQTATTLMLRCSVISWSV